MSHRPALHTPTEGAICTNTITELKQQTDESGRLVDTSRLAPGSKHTRFLHCLPIHNGQEITWSGLSFSLELQLI